MRVQFIKCLCLGDMADREILVPVTRVKHIETNTDGDDRVYTDDGVYIPANEGNVYFSVTELQSFRRA